MAKDQKTRIEISNCAELFAIKVCDWVDAEAKELYSYLIKDIKVQRGEITTLEAALEGAERSAVKREEAHQEERADFLARESELRLWAEGAINEGGELKKRLHMSGEYRVIHDLHREIDRLKVKLSNCHYWSSPEFCTPALLALKLIHKESCGPGYTNSE